MHSPLEPTCGRHVTHGPHRWRETGGQRRTIDCPGSQVRPRAHVVGLRRGALSPRALKAYGWQTPADAARALGLSPSTLRRVIAGDIAPGERVIAALLAGTGHTFEGLFEVH